MRSYFKLPALTFLLLLYASMAGANADTAKAADTPDSANSAAMPAPGDCALFREGGEGAIFKGPVYYVKGPITEIYRRRHSLALCPRLGKLPERYSRADWQQIAQAYPCVTDERQAREIEVIRVRFRAEQWDTPWTQQHGHNGWLFRGHFLDVELKQGVELDVDGTLLLRCDAAP